jgi:hypothetical protein
MMSTADTQHLTVTEFQEWLSAAQPGERKAGAKGHVYLVQRQLKPGA